MAARLLPLQSILHIFQPISFARQPLLDTPVIRRILQPTLVCSPLAPTIAAFAGVSDLLREIWDGLLRAVPKKKTSHMKKRHRQMAGKALKDVTNLNRCSACGRLKRSHILCTYCLTAVRQFVQKTVLGVDDSIKHPGPQNRSTHNIAEVAPQAWQAIKTKREKQARKQAKKKMQDLTQW